MHIDIDSTPQYLRHKGFLHDDGVQLRCLMFNCRYQMSTVQCPLYAVYEAQYTIVDVLRATSDWQGLMAGGIQDSISGSDYPTANVSSPTLDIRSAMLVTQPPM